MKQAGVGDVILALDDEGNKLCEFLVVQTKDKLQALHKPSLKVQKGDVFGKTEDELLEMTGDYVDEVEILKEPSKVAEYFFDQGEER